MQLIYTKKTHLCTVLSTVSIGFNIALNIIFIMKWGAIGAAWGTFLAAVISGSIYFIVAQRHYLIKWEYLKVSTIILTFFVSAVLIVVMRNASVDYAMRLIVKGAAISLYVYLGIKFNVITTDNFNLIKNTFNLRNQLIKVTHR
jgi:O-antigen/teichoic acid export membrane protein